MPQKKELQEIADHMSCIGKVIGSGWWARSDSYANAGGDYDRSVLTSWLKSRAPDISLRPMSVRTTAVRGSGGAVRTDLKPPYEMGPDEVLLDTGVDP